MASVANMGVTASAFLPESFQVLYWRFAQLCAVGFEERAALTLATDPTVDLHQATDLLRRGCPAETALNILL